MTARKRNENYDYRAAANQYAHLADEFLRTYFVLGVNNVRLNVRYFIMAHCLELAFKASLANRSVPIDYGIHNLADLEADLVQQGDSCFEQLRPDANAREVFTRICHRNVREFHISDWQDHQEALELLLCYAYNADLKYGMDKAGGNILAVTISTVIMNSRFLGYIACARRNFLDRGQLGREIIKFVAQIEQRWPKLFSRASAILQT